MTHAITSDGSRIAYESHGSAGEPLLLIAGQSLDRHGWWDHTVAEFAVDHRVVVFDHRGTGASDATFRPAWSTRDFATDAVAVLDAVGVDRAHVLGHSMGGRVAQWLAVDHPDRVSRLVLASTSAGDLHGVVRSAAATSALRSMDLADLTAMLYPPGWAEQHPDLARSVTPAPNSAESLAAPRPTTRPGKPCPRSSRPAWWCTGPMIR